MEVSIFCMICHLMLELIIFPSAKDTHNGPPRGYLKFTRYCRSMCFPVSHASSSYLEGSDGERQKDLRSRQGRQGRIAWHGFNRLPRILHDGNHVRSSRNVQYRMYYPRTHHGHVLQGMQGKRDNRLALIVDLIYFHRVLISIDVFVFRKRECGVFSH